MKRYIVLLLTFLTLALSQLQIVAHDFSHFASDIQQSQSSHDDANKGCDDCVKFKHLSQFDIHSTQTSQLFELQDTLIQKSGLSSYTDPHKLFSARGPPQIS
jgi:hypothetical protein